MLVVARRYGQLGNRLVRAAHLIAAALERGDGFADLSFGEYAVHFEGTRRDWLCRFPARRGLLRPGRLAQRAARRLGKLGLWLSGHLGRPRAIVWSSPEEDCPLEGAAAPAPLARPGLLLLDGWRFRSRALPAHAEVVRRHFAPAAEHARAVIALLARLRARAEVIVGVHVRRGDYASWQGGRYCWDAAAYAALARRVSALLGDRRVVFLVASDQPIEDADWAGLPFARAPGQPVEDLYALAACDYLFGPPSTFSQWASFHGRVPLWIVERPDAVPTMDDFRPRSV